jgi:hypothetical protein
VPDGLDLDLRLVAAGADAREPGAEPVVGIDGLDAVGEAFLDGACLELDDERGLGEHRAVLQCAVVVELFLRDRTTGPAVAAGSVELWRLTPEGELDLGSGSLPTMRLADVCVNP